MRLDGLPVGPNGGGKPQPHCRRCGAPGPSGSHGVRNPEPSCCLGSWFFPRFSSRRMSPETFVWFPRAGLSPGCDCVPSGRLTVSGDVCGCDSWRWGGVTNWHWGAAWHSSAWAGPRPQVSPRQPLSVHTAARGGGGPP